MNNFVFASEKNLPVKGGDYADDVDQDNHNNYDTLNTNWTDLKLFVLPEMPKKSPQF